MKDCFYNSKIEVTSPVQLVTCGYENCIENFSCGPNIRDHYLIHYIISGEGYFEGYGKRYMVSPGEIFVIFPGEIAKYYAPYQDKKWTFVWIGFSGSYAEYYLRQLNISRDCPVQRLNGKQLIDSIADCLEYIAREKEKCSQLMLDAYALKCLASLQAQAEKNQRAADCTEMYVNEAMQYIKYYYMKQISVGNVAEYLNISRSYLFRVFKKHIGISPQQYLISYRMKQAKELLGHGCNVTETANAVGFQNIYAFSAMFKEFYGASPSHFISEENKENL